MTPLNKIKSPVKNHLSEFDHVFGKHMSSKIPLLNIITKYVLKTKGKQLRPLLVFLSADICGEINESTYHAASLVELSHTATLVHDDVVDDANERRGFFSINALWKSKVAVLMGDYLLAKGLQIATDNNEYHLLKTVSEAVQVMIEGELLQLQKSRHLNTNEEDYFKIIKGKTASLIAACTKGGAQSVTTDRNLIDSLTEFGLNLGVAFQIKDDLFDYESTSKTGKPKGNDIKEKKFTLPLIHALRTAPKNETKSIKRLIGKGAGSQSILDVISFVKKYDGIEYAREKMKEYQNNAKEILNKFPDSESKQSLLSLSDFVIDRKK